jgi:hypothetical protein
MASVSFYELKIEGHTPLTGTIRFHPFWVLPFDLVDHAFEEALFQGAFHLFVAEGTGNFHKNILRLPLRWRGWEGPWVLYPVSGP